MINHYKRLSKIWVFFFIILTLMGSSTYAQLVTNGGFESSNVGIVDSAAGVNDFSVEGWFIQAVAGINPPPVFEIVSDTVEQGNRALKVTVGGLGSNQWDIQAVADSIPVTPGATYNYSVWARAEKPGAQVNFTVGNYSYFEYKFIGSANLTTGWKEYTMQFTVTDTSTVIRAPIHFGYSGNIGNAIYIDNMRIADVNAGKTPVRVEAESGKLGDSLAVMQEDSISYITALSNYTSLTSPDDTSRIATYQVTFQDSGYYNLFIRVRVGPGTYNDDSFFYGRGFGEKSDTAAADWVFINGLASAGFTGEYDTVNAAGGASSGVWKWVNVTKNSYQGAPGDSFYVSLDSLTKTFQIATREDGLDIDKFAFGRSDLFFTVGDLDGIPPKPIFIWKGPPLASKQPKFVGNIYNTAQVDNFTSYWNQVTPENAGKWNYVEVKRDTFYWGNLDAAYNLAKNNGFPFIFHVLVYGSNVPAWIDTLQTADQLVEIRKWFQAVATRYPDIDYLQVVNEGLPNHNPPDGRSGRINLETALGGAGTTGHDWIINAFKMAREIFPAKTKLMFNDYNIINSTTNTDTVINLINLLKAQNLIDAVGDEGHADQIERYQKPNMVKNLDKLASTGLPVIITEFDEDSLTIAPYSNQLQNYQKFFPMLYEHPGVIGITLWGWKTPMYIPDAYLINPDGSERPALVWLRNYLDTVNVVVGVNDISQAPNKFQLFNNYPNPFNPSTNIRYSIANTSKVTLKIYDVLGKEVRSLVDEVKSPGQYTVTFNAEDLASGIYFYQLNAGSFTATKKLVLLK